MEFVMKAGGIPAGNYRARFVGAEAYNENVEKYGQGVLLKWQVLDGEQAGNDASRICSAKLTPKTALGKFAVALKGGAIETGERFSFAAYVGATGSLLVEATENGGSRVSAFFRDAQPQQQPPQVVGQTAPAALSSQPVAPQPAAAYSQPMQPPAAGTQQPPEVF